MNQTGQPVKIISCKDKENLLRQRAVVIWLTGLSGSGKTTLAHELEIMLYKDHFLTKILDGDELRSGLNSSLGFSDADRYENIRRVAEVAKLFSENGIITLCCFISPLENMREMAGNIIGKDKFIEVYLDCPLEICEKRDIKGLYSKARDGKIQQFTGISSAYEVPPSPDVIVNTYSNNVAQSAEIIYKKIIPLIKMNK